MTLHLPARDIPVPEVTGSDRRIVYDASRDVDASEA